MKPKQMDLAFFWSWDFISPYLHEKQQNDGLLSMHFKKIAFWRIVKIVTSNLLQPSGICKQNPAQVISPGMKQDT